MPAKKGPYQVTSSTKIYSDHFITVRKDDIVLPNGKEGTYATAEIIEGVAVVALTDKKEVHLIKQYRYALEDDSLEVISGAIDGQEKPLEAARREAREEAGIEAKQWESLGHMYLDTSIAKGKVHLYLARELSYTSTDPDDSEELKKITIPLHEAISKVMNSEVVHSPSCVSLLKAWHYLINKQ